jgi:hypothetical protein
MVRKRNSPESIGEIIARLMDIKRKIIEAGIASGDLGPAREVIEGVSTAVRLLREELENQLRNGTLEDMTPEQAQEAINNTKILEGSLKADFPEVGH